MRKVFVFIFCLVALGAKGQLLSDYPKGVDAHDFNIYYGSLTEYNMEEGQKYNSLHGRLIMCIGAKAIYLKEIATYMVEKLNCDNHITADNEEYPSAFLVKPGGIIGVDEDDSPVRIIADTDDSLRMKKVTITGNTELLVKLFLNYWYRSELKFDINKFKKGCLFYQNCGSDRVSFNWKGVKPNITITRNPTFPIPLPTVAERS